MILDGRSLAAEVLARTKARSVLLDHAPRVLVLSANETPATLSYLKIKEKRASDAGCVLERKRFPEDAPTEELVAAIRNSTADVVLVQLPLSSDRIARDVCDAIPLEKDADVLSAAAREKFEKGESGALLPPVVAAVREIFEHHNIIVEGKRAVVIGAGFLVGGPCATWLRQQGAVVECVTSDSGNVHEALATADILISGAGSPHLIQPAMLQQGVVLIDAGTSESNGEIVGDADPACAEKCSLFTPVPGGMGPLAVACLFENVVTLKEGAKKVQ